MTPEIYAEWLRRQGQRVLRTESSYWHSESWGVYQAFPYHWLINPSQDEMSELFSIHRALALRYSMPTHVSEGCPSYAIVFEGQTYDIELFGHRTRKNTRRGLKNCSVEPMSLPELVDLAWELRLDALDRQKRHLSISLDSWRKRYLTASDLPGFQAWGAQVNGRLAGYIVTFRMDECLCIIDHQSHRDFLDLNINNALTYTVSRDAVGKPGLQLVFYGLESLDAEQRVSEFKFHMGYVAKPIKQRVLFRPPVGRFASRLGYQLVSALSKLRPSDRRFSKAKGMLKLSLSERTLDLPHGESLGGSRPIDRA